MFPYLLCIQAKNFILVCDTSRKPFLSLEPFENGCHLLLHDLIFDHMSKIEIENGFKNTILVIHGYMRKQKEKNKECQITSNEIKLLLATSIIAKFGLGDFDIDLLGLLADFDEDLVTHFNCLCEYDMTSIRQSASKKLENYTYDDYIKNRSLGFAALAYGTCLYQLTLCQVKEGRWCYKKNCVFEKELAKHNDTIGESLEIVFRTNKDHCGDYHISFYDVLYKKHDYDSANDYFTTYGSEQTILFFVYSYSEIFTAIKQGLDNNPLIPDPYMDIFYTIQDNTNLSQIKAKVFQLMRDKKLGCILLAKYRKPMKFEIHTALKDYVNLKNLDKWKKDTRTLCEEMSLLELMIYRLNL